jgi:uridine phosphorylase
MMDFFVREVRAVVDGPMAIIRFGTCGGLTDHSRAGIVVVATEGSSYISRNYDFFPNANESTPYFFYQVLHAFLLLSCLVGRSI